MFLARRVDTKSRASLLGLQVWKPHLYLSSTLRVQILRTARDDRLTRCLRIRFNHTSIKTVEDVQAQDNVTDTPSFKPDAKLGNWFNPITSHQGVQIRKIVPFRSSKVSSTKLSALAGDRIFGDECAPQQSDSQTKKELRMKMWGEKARRHKKHNALAKELHMVKADASYDWRTPLQLLIDNSPARYTDLPLERGYNSGGIVKLRHLRADRIPRPPVWTIDTFVYYLELLTQSSVTHWISRQLYGNGSTHVAEVSRILTEAFKSPAAREFLSPQAFNVAIQFFCAHAAIPQAVALLEYMEWLCMKIPSETMNNLLRGCAINKDLYNFTMVLRKCINIGIAPSAATWVILLGMTRLRDAQNVIVESMQERFMLEDTRTIRGVMRGVLRENIRGDISIHLDNGRDLTSFLELMDSQFGTDWLSSSSSASNIILDELGQRKTAAEVVGMLHTLMERGMKIGEATLNMLLRFCSRERDHLLAIRVLRLHFRHGVSADTRTFDILFMQAWRSRLYNFARVIWRTACMQGMVSQNTKLRVRNKLLYHETHRPNDGPSSKARIWSESAGEVIVGIKPAYDLDKFLSSNPVTKATNSRGEKRDELIDHDIATAFRYRLVDGLPKLLTDALKLDRIWTESGAWREESSEWKRKMAIPVLVTEVHTDDQGYSIYDQRPLSLSMSAGVVDD